MPSDRDNAMNALLEERNTWARQLADKSDELDTVKAELRELRDLYNQLDNWRLKIQSQPADGWYTIGTHANRRVGLEFYGDDGYGMPLWERPVPFKLMFEQGFKEGRGK